MLVIRLSRVAFPKFQLSKKEKEGEDWKEGDFIFLDEKTGKYTNVPPAVESVAIPPVDFPEFTAEYVKELQGKLKEAMIVSRYWRLVYKMRTTLHTNLRNRYWIYKPSSNHSTTISTQEDCSAKTIPSPGPPKTTNERVATPC